MYQLSDYPAWVIILFIRLLDKHLGLGDQCMDLVSRILMKHYLVTTDENLAPAQFTEDGLRNLIRMLFVEDHEEQQKQTQNPSTVAVAHAFGGLAPPPNDVAADAFRRIYERAWKRLTNDLIRGVHEDDQQLEKLKQEFPEFAEPQAAVLAPQGKNGTSSLSQAAQGDKKTAGASPLAAPVPEAVKKQPSRTPTPTPPQLKKDSVPQTLPPQALPPQTAHPALPQPQPQPAPTPLRQLQPVPTAKTQEAPRPNGATQVLQPPPGVSGVSQQTLPPHIASGRQASPAALTPHSESGLKGKPSSGVGQPSPGPPLKWEAPYQGPQTPTQRPLQPSVNRNLAPQPTPQTAVSKWPPSQATAQAGAQVSTPHHPAVSPSPQPVLAPPHTGQLALPVPPGQKQGPAASPNITQQPRPRLPPNVPSQHPGTPPPPPPPLQGQQVFQAPKQRQGKLHNQPLQRLVGPASTSPLSTPGGTPAPLQRRPPQPSHPSPSPQPQKVVASQLPSFSPPPAVLVVQSEQDAQKKYVSPYAKSLQSPVPPPSRPARSDARSDAAKNEAVRSAAAQAITLSKVRGVVARAVSTQATPRTPQPSPSFGKTGYGTLWTATSTPGTPGPPLPNEVVDSPAFEPLSPPLPPTAQRPTTPYRQRRSTPRSAHNIDTPAGKGRGTVSRSGRKTHRNSNSQAMASAGPSQPDASQPDELSLDQGNALKVKDEESTPRPMPEETGDTTADESATSRRQAPIGSFSASRPTKRKRQDSDPLPPTGPPTHVSWTRGFPKVSGAALDQIGGNRHANMFANPIRERDAPGYNGVVLRPTDIQSIKKAINNGHKFATQAAVNLPGGDPGTPTVLLPIGDDLVPPKGIINTAQLERELVHMFCNAIMYNPDPNRGPGRGFMRPSYATDGDGSVGYKVDEFGVVKDTISMYVEVEKLLTDLRNAENQRNPAANSLSMLPSVTRTGSVVTAGEDTADDMDELAQDDVSNTSRRKRTKV